MVATTDYYNVRTAQQIMLTLARQLDRADPEHLEHLLAILCVIADVADHYYARIDTDPRLDHEQVEKLIHQLLSEVDPDAYPNNNP